jgi:hypothetical protein
VDFSDFVSIFDVDHAACLDTFVAEPKSPIIKGDQVHGSTAKPPLIMLEKDVVAAFELGPVRDWNKSAAIRWREDHGVGGLIGHFRALDYWHRTGGGTLGRGQGRAVIRSYTLPRIYRGRRRTPTRRRPVHFLSQ